MFKITIEKTEEVVRLVGREWKVVGQEGEGPQARPQYGYTPEVEKTVTVSTQIFEQVVDELDLPKVIAVVNGIEIASSS